jgi:uncharacterized protein (DUF58 family)
MPPAAVAALDFALVRRAGGRMPGEHRGVGVGAGAELAQLRPYQVGDDVRQIDPAASARTGVTHVRLQVPERALTTWVLLDLSPSMAFGSGTRLKSDVAEGVATVVARLGVRRGGRIGLVTCGAPVRHVLPPAGGRRALGAVDRLLAAGVAPDGQAPAEDLAGALHHVREIARQPGLVVVVSDLRDEGPWPRALRHLVAAGQQVIAAEIADPREHDLPRSGVLTLVDPESGRLVEADTRSERLREAFARRERERRERIADELRRAGARHAPLSTEGDWLRDLGKAMR